MTEDADTISTERPASKSRSNFLTPDGGLVTINAPGYELNAPWSATLRIRMQRPYAGVPAGLQLRELYITHAGNHDRVIERVLGGRVVERLETQNGLFLIAHSRTQDRGLALWRGRCYEAATWLPAVASIPRSAALRYFERLVFTDSPLGLKVETSSPYSESIEVMEVSKHIPGVGFLDIKDTESGAGLIPSWAGAPVPTGEVWRKSSLPDADAPTSSVLLHVTPTTVTILTGEQNRRNEEGFRLRFLEALTQLSWTRK